MHRASAFLVFLSLAGCAGAPHPAPSTQAAAVAVARAPTPAAEPTTDVRERSGRLARVRLLRAFRIADDDAQHHGAPGGIGFEFLIMRPPGAEGAFTLRELRDATLSGNSYRELTRKTLGRAYEPQSSILDPSDVRMADGRSVGEALGVSAGDAIVMRTLLYGVRVRGAGPLSVIPDVGFGDNEKLEFTLLLETLQPEPASF